MIMLRTENGEERKHQAEMLESSMWDPQPHCFGILDPLRLQTSALRRMERTID